MLACFVRGITDDPDDAAISTAIVALGHALGLTVTAEGLETEAQVELLRKQGCDQIQGYFFSRPVPPAAIADLLRDQRGAVRASKRAARRSGNAAVRSVTLSAAKES